MATTAIWKVKGNLGQVVNYAATPDKTTLTTKDLQGLRDVMDYATQNYKTEEQRYVSGVNCVPEIARDQIMMVKRQLGKKGGIIAFHGYQSFTPREVKTGKYLAVRSPGKQRFVRLKSLGDNYTEEAIRERIRAHELPPRRRRYMTDEIIKFDRYVEQGKLLMKYRSTPGSSFPCWKKLYKANLTPFATNGKDFTPPGGKIPREQTALPESYLSINLSKSYGWS